MKNAALLVVMTTFLLLFVSERGNAAAWTLPYGEIQVIRTYSFYTTDFAGHLNGEARKKEQFFKLEFQMLVEMGVTNDLTIGISPTLQNLTSHAGSSDVTNNFGLASTDIFLRQKIWKNDSSILSVQPLVKLFGAYSNSFGPDLGKKQIDFEARGLLGHSFEYRDAWHFVNFEAAFRKRLEEPGDEFRYDVSLGYRFFGDLLFLPQISGIYALERSETEGAFVTNSTDFDLTKLQLSFVKEVDENLSVQLGGYSHISKRNTGGGGGVIISLWRSF